MFRLYIYASHLQDKVIFTSEGDTRAVGNTVVDCEISHDTFKNAVIKIICIEIICFLLIFVSWCIGN
jgi:hypothetical protein